MKREPRNEDAEFGGSRRSVFDLLAEKYPDLQDEKPKPAPRVAVAEAPPTVAAPPAVEASPEAPPVAEASPDSSPVAAAAAPSPAAVAAARTNKATTGSLGKRAAFGGTLALLLVAGMWLLSRFEPKHPAVAATEAEAKPAPELGAAKDPLEPERVVVPPGAAGGSEPEADPPQAVQLPSPRSTARESQGAAKPPEPKKQPTPTAELKPTPSKPASSKPTPSKPTPSKPTPSQILIEPEAPILPPVRIGGTQPEYPVEARAAGVEGKVVLFGIIGRDGKVRDARVVRHLSPPLDAAALAAFRSWRFQPATQKGKKVDFKYNAGIEFRINSPTEQVAEAGDEDAGATGQGNAARAAPKLVTQPLAYDEDFTPPVRITMVWPQKPPGTQMVKGEVKLQLLVDAAGSVQNVEVLEGLPQGVTEAAIEAVRQWKFKPARRNGEPVAVYHRVSLRF